MKIKDNKQQEAMKVSIITSCYNRASTIRDAIESVLNQDYADIEYIVIDAASSDGTLDIVRQYSGKITHIVSEKDNGIYEGLNKGIRLATGDVIGLLHSDDEFYATDTISQIVHEFESTGSDVVYGNGLFVRTSNKNYVVRDWISGGFESDSIRHGWLPLHTTVFVKREVMQKVGQYNEEYKISADTDWLIRCLYKNHFRVSYLNEYIVRMCLGGASTSFRLTRRKWSEDMRIYASHGINQYVSLTMKVLSKLPQYAKAKLKNWLKVYKPKRQAAKSDVSAVSEAPSFA